MAVTPFVQFSGEDGVAVMNDEPVRMIAPKRLSKLLQRPVRRRVVSKVPMKNPSGALFENDEHVEQPKARGDNHEEIARNDGFGVVADEGQPPLFGIRLPHGSRLPVPGNRAG